VRLLRYTVWLLAACELYAAEPDRAVLTVMRSSASDIDHVRVIKRVAVDAELDLVVALGAQKGWATDQGNFIWWGDHRTLGILLQRRSRPDLIYKVAISKGEGDCEVRVERATVKDVVFSCTPEKGGPGPNHKFVYDIHSKALVKQIEYEPFSLQRIFASGQDAVLVGSDTRRLVAVKYNPADEPAFHLLKGTQAQQWTQRIETSAGTSGFGTNLKQVIYLKPKQFKPVRFGPGNRFTLTQEGERLIVLDQTGKMVKRYPLPQSSYAEFARLRPSRASDGYTRQATAIDEAIGPWQIADGTVWFAKAFYDGEGNTGVGGFGHFDTEQLKYRIYSPREIADWSATAMLVEPEAVWVGVASNGEYRASGGGLLRFARATQQPERIEFRCRRSPLVGYRFRSCGFERPHAASILRGSDCGRRAASERVGRWELTPHHLTTLINRR
jgi:hypothetical protein